MEAHDMFLFSAISFLETALKIQESSRDVKTRVLGLLNFSLFWGAFERHKEQGMVVQRKNMGH